MAPISVTSKIKRHFNSIPQHQLVSTRDLLVHGTREGVDTAIYRLIKKGFIRRVADGVFIRWDARWPKEEEIALFIAAAFGREIRKLGCSTYLIDGCSSSFICKGRRVFFRRTSKKHLHLQDNETGKALIEICTIGPEALENIDWRTLPWSRSRAAIDQVLLERRWLPAWLSDKFKSKQYLGPSKIVRTL